MRERRNSEVFFPYTLGYREWKKLFREIKFTVLTRFLCYGVDDCLATPDSVKPRSPVFFSPLSGTWRKLFPYYSNERNFFFALAFICFAQTDHPFVIHYVYSTFIGERVC